MSSNDPGQAEIDAATVSRLLHEQFPHLAGHTVTAIPSAGAGNALFRLGDDLLVRLPRHRGTVMAIGIELEWLPWLARQLPLAIPVPVAAGTASATFARPWAIFEWHDGAPLDSNLENVDLADVAIRLGGFVAALQMIETTGAPISLRPHPLQNGDAEIRRNIDAFSAEGLLDQALAASVWEAVTTESPSESRVWIHADLFPMNLLTAKNRLSAVIDFDLMGVGDPAVDMLPAWALLTEQTRPLFREASHVDDRTWIRGRGFALAGALGVLRKYRGTGNRLVATGMHMLREVIADYQKAE